MKINTHTINNIKIAEIVSGDVLIETADDGLDLMGNLYYQGFDSILIADKNLTSDFFNLKTGIAGEILQKFSNYRIRLAIVGDFTPYTGKSIQGFIRESNTAGRINFVGSTADGLKVLSTKSR